VVLRLPYRAPLDADGLFAFLGLRAVPGVEEVVDGAYRRSLRLPHGVGTVELRAVDGHVRARYRLEDLRDLATAVQRSRTLLDLDSDPQAVVEALGDDPVLGASVRAAPGLRVAGHVDGQELALRAVLGQQVSLAGATTLAARLVAAIGEPLDQPLGSVTHLFPSSGALAEIDPAALAMPASRRRALLGLAAALAGGELVLDAGVEREAARQQLLALPGIGPWTAAYVAMRALRDPDAFLPTDLGVRHALEQLGQDSGPAPATRLAEAWRPYRAYAVQHLWASLTSDPRTEAIAA
jgi:AraC family transcriptional regulator of adaptative response / DNA-3-methyladenine glycosylase II